MKTQAWQVINYRIFDSCDGFLRYLLVSHCPHIYTGEAAVVAAG